jgi:hypothetical protein
MKNKGIVISGGQFSAAQIAVGDQASISNDSWREGSELVRKLDELLSAIQAADLQPNEQEKVVKHINTVKDQAKAANPDKTVMETSLLLVEKAVPAITGIVSIITSVRGLVGL